MSDILLEVKNLSVDFHMPGKVAHAVKNVSFTLEKGKTLALVGESGSGKSVTALSVMKLLPYPVAQHPNGAIMLRGDDLINKSDRQMRALRGNDIAMIFQEPMTALNPLHTIEKQIGEVLLLHKGQSLKQARPRILELLDLVGLSALKDRLRAYPHELSGGQRQRVMIAMALASEPELLIADEPTTALDVTVQAKVLKLMQELQQKLGMAMIFITHDLGIVEEIAHDVCVMHQGEIVEAGSVKQVFNKPKHPYTKALIAAKPSGVADSIEIGDELITTVGLKVYFPKKKTFFGKITDVVKAVDDVDLTIRQGETLGIVGESGSGKTTLALALMRLIKSEGPIVFQGTRIDQLTGQNLRKLRGDIQIIFQDPFGSLSPRLTVAQIIEEGLTIHNKAMDAVTRDQRVIDVLNEVSIDPETRHRYPHEFSGGQRQRISIARALVLKPSVIVLDEPTSALDVSVQAQVIKLLKKLQKNHGLTYLFISHDLRVIRALSHRILVMKQGQIVEQGTANEIFETPMQEYTKTLITAAFNSVSTKIS